MRGPAAWPPCPSRIPSDPPSFPQFGLGPSGPDCGSSGRGFIFDYYWGTELYPRLGGVDVKRFVNCRFSMTYWMLAG